MFVRDVAASLAWYRDELGFSADYSYGEPPFYAQVSRQSVSLNLRRAQVWPWAVAPGDEELLVARLEVDDVKSLFLELRDRAVSFHRPLRTEPWGQATFVVADPDGNLISIGSHMPRPT